MLSWFPPSLVCLMDALGVSLMDALAAVRNEEIRLRSAALLQSSSSLVLVACSSSKASTPPMAPSSVVPSF